MLNRRMDCRIKSGNDKERSSPDGAKRNPGFGGAGFDVAPDFAALHPGYGLQLEQFLRVAVGDAFFIFGAHRDLVQEGTRLRHRLIGMIG
jgi:hypothetical protein